MIARTCTGRLPASLLRIVVYGLSLAATVVGTKPAASEPLRSPLEPAESIAHFRLDAALRIELVAHEPQVVDPIAVRFDERGRMWVVEMRDYPHGPADGEPPRSRIRILEDRDGDGRFEHATTFADALLFATGLQPWRGGAIVTLAGEVAYFKDTDGDGTADLRETWFRGFAAKNPQLRANHPRLAHDGRVYVANGLRGGKVVDARDEKAKPVSISGRDFRFDPRTGHYEAVSGNGQFGLTFDDFGSRFVCNNRQPMDHVVLENRHLARNPFLAVPGVLAHVAAGGADSRVFPLTAAWTTSNLHAGQFTAACGVTLFRGDALPNSYHGNLFVCEPTGSLVHREIVEADGVTFNAQPAYADREFLASPDSWFRPVNLSVGPDGALYVVDMYRAVIEHPQFMPSELQQRPDLRLGDDRGRIYRIVPAEQESKSQVVDLPSASPAELVALLEHDNSWWRDTAVRLLLERADPAATQHLERIAAGGPRPFARVAALWALAGQQALSDQHVAGALRDEDARVRASAVVLAESRLAGSSELRAAVIARAADDDPRVRFRAALAIGGVESHDVVGPLVQIALRGVDDVWTRRAVATARPQHVAAMLPQILASDQVVAAEHGAAEHRLIAELAAIVGARRDADEVGRLITLVCAEPTRAASESALLGLAGGLARREGLLAFVAGLPQADELGDRLDTVFERIAADAADETLTEAVRASKLDLLQHARGESIADTCLRIVQASPTQSLSVRAAAVLANQPGERVAESLLDSYPAQTPQVRRAIVDALIAQPAGAALLLEAIQSNRIARAELDQARENKLRGHRDAAVAKLAKKVLLPTVAAERSAVLADYQPVLKLAGDPRTGRQLFQRHCAVCHRIGELGVNVAPDISDSRVKTPAQLLTDILNPNQAIDNNYVSYTIATHDGNIHTGIIGSETAGSITLRQQENKTVSVLRADIAMIRTSGVSLMPEGFEKHLSQQQMADLIGFIKNWRYLEQPVPGTIAPEGN